MIADFIGAFVLVTLSSFQLWRQERFFGARLKAQEQLAAGREDVIYRQQKAAQRDITAQQREAEKLASSTRALQEETRLLHERIDQHFAHPAIKRVLG